uniref:Protein YIPF n=1 Tax=Aceria tosichella TaxID=561515 RepID=A0A6G1SB28_9ACAR
MSDSYDMSAYSHYADMSYDWTYYNQQQQNMANQNMINQEMTYPTDMMSNQDTTNHPDDYEPPLLEELEINLEQIRQKTWAVLTFKSLNDHKNILQDPDLAGPLTFLLTFGFLLLLSGKIQFGYIYGLGTLGCLIIHSVVYLVAAKNISFMCTVSVLGYCILPMVMLSALSILINLKATLVGSILSVVAILWCAIGASNLLVTAVDITNARLMIAYPCALFYTVFALLTVF